MKIHKQFGMTLIELMVALAIGAFLMIGAITVFMQTRTTFRVTESLSRMQENARFAIDIIEPDVRMAHYWGLTTTTTNVFNRARPTAAPFPGILHTCGNNFLVNFDQAVSGSNNSFGLAAACLPSALVGPVEANADTLVVRHVTEDFEALPLVGANTLRVQSQRGGGDSAIFRGTVVPPPPMFDPATSRTHRVIVNAYYVSRSSSATVPGVNVVPSLRMRSLQADGTIPDQELVAGIEDLQVQFGIDTNAPGDDNRGSIDRYVNANDPLVEPFNPLANVEILSVRVWLRVRAERPENGFQDTAVYQYAGQNFGPFNDNFRRMVVSKTIYLRNARPNS
jgi:type IV pilus assembly protein PilW